MRIAVVGAGAIGGWLAVHLARAGHAVSVLARGETRDAIRANGLVLREGGRTFAMRVTASDDPAELGAQELVIVAVKSRALTSVAPAVAILSGPETVVLPAMNGIGWWFPYGLGPPLEGATLSSIDPGGAIAARIPPARVIGCVVHVSSSVAAPGVIAHTAGRRLIVGEPDGNLSARLSRVGAALREANLEIEISPRIQKDVWYKLWGNMTMNPVSALTRATCDRILDNTLVKRFVLAVMAEAREVGTRIGCPIAESGEDRTAVTRRLGPIKTSMLQDVEAGRPLEIDALLEGPREIAQLASVPTPSLDALCGLARLLDSSLQSAWVPFNRSAQSV